MKGLTKDAGQAAAQLAPSKKGLLGLFNKVEDAKDVKGVVSDAASAFKDALPDAGKAPYESSRTGEGLQGMSKILLCRWLLCRW